MASIINAGTTTATALNMITDTTGAMKIQTSGVDAINISNVQVVTLAHPLLPASGGTGVSSLGTGVATSLGQNVTGSGGIVLGTSPSIASPTLTGTPVAPTATAGTNTTQVATTAFVTTFANTLGTMSTQNANAVAITGGTIGSASAASMGTNSYGARTVSTSAPSGGSNGDIWYRV